MKRINVKDIILDKVYFKVCVGAITEITFKSISEERAIIHFIHAGFDDDCYLADIGIDCPTSYNNNFNTIVETYDEAAEIINNESYKERLHNHKENCNYMDDIFYL